MITFRRYKSYKIVRIYLKADLYNPDNYAHQGMILYHYYVTVYTIYIIGIYRIIEVLVVHKNIMKHLNAVIILHYFNT